jgi:ABC-2 type transport system ATP-binding protein
MTVGSMLRFFGSARGLSGERLAARMSAVIEQCELQPIVETPVGKLSKGLRQRVGTAQALLHDPDVLIMDEPTAGLDPNQIRRFRAHVLRLRGTKTVLMSTHILAEVTAVAERVLLLHEGRLLFDGTPDEMSLNGSLDEAFYRLTREAC